MPITNFPADDELRRIAVKTRGRTLLFRVRYGVDMSSRLFGWPSNPDWKQKPGDDEYFRQHPPA